MKTYTAANIGGSADVVVGAGGLAGSPAGANNGGGGGVSSFDPAGTGVTLTCTGGNGSVGTTATNTSSNSARGAGNTSSGGDVNIKGQTGDNGYWFATNGFAIGGRGGDSILGFGGASLQSIGNNGNSGLIGDNYGGGASGANISNTTSVTGSAGAQGICIITEYISISA